MNKFNVFVIRAILGSAFAVILIRLFYPQANIFYVILLGICLVGLAYLFEYLGKKIKQKGPVNS